MRFTNYTADAVWLNALDRILLLGEAGEPRGKNVREVPGAHLLMHMLRPVVTHPARKLSYRFMAAEAHWILSGDDSVEGVAPWNPNIVRYSDDGKTFFGAYGPRFRQQLDHVVEKLLADPYSRQAGLTLWRQNPPETKDVPCTVAMFFSVRGGKLDAHVFMRSSDAWLGLPYDVFNFSMAAYLVCAKLQERGAGHIEPRWLYLTMANSHLYQENLAEAKAVLEATKDDIQQLPAPEILWCSETALMNTLKSLRDSKPGEDLRWWEKC